MTPRIVAASAILSLIASSAFAAGSGWYGAGYGANTYVSDADMRGGGLTESRFDSGYGVGFAVGMSMEESGFAPDRYEAEIAFSGNEIDGISGPGAIPTGGDLVHVGLMGNAYYDIPTGTPIIPYIGAGLGLASIYYETDAVFADDDDTVLAWQAMAGLTYAPEQMQQVELYGGYKYLGTSDPSFGLAGGGSFDMEFDQHAVQAGLRVRF